MSKKGNIFKVIVLGAVLIIAGIVMMFFFIRGEKEKITDGKPVTCTITSVSRTGRHYSAQGFYMDDEGNKVNAEIINTVMPSVRDVEEGFIVPDKPGKVFLKTPIWLACLFTGLSLMFVIAGTAVIVCGVKSRADEKLMASEGTLTRGRITDIRRDGSGKAVFWIAKVVYTDSYGAEHTFEDYSDANHYRHVGDMVNVRYVRKKNGKYANEII